MRWIWRRIARHIKLVLAALRVSNDHLTVVRLKIVDFESCDGPNCTNPSRALPHREHSCPTAWDALRHTPPVRWFGRSSGG